MEIPTFVGMTTAHFVAGLSIEANEKNILNK